MVLSLRHYRFREIPVAGPVCQLEFSFTNGYVPFKNDKFFRVSFEQRGDVCYLTKLISVLDDRRKKSQGKAEQQSEDDVSAEERHHLEHDSPGSSHSKSSVMQQQKGANLRSAATSLIVTASHLLLYLPALLLLGLQASFSLFPEFTRHLIELSRSGRTERRALW